MPKKKKTDDEVKETTEKIGESLDKNPSESKEMNLKEVVSEDKKEVVLAPLETYIKVSIHIGTRAVTPTMKEYVYRRKADGIAVLNTKKIDEKISQGGSFLSQFAPGDIIICGKKDAVVKPVEAFSKATGIRAFTRYPAGIITNPSLKNFFEPKLVFVIDPWVDKNALNDAVKTKIPIMALCSTNNNTHNVDFVIPCNNKTTNSVGLVLYLLSKIYLEKRKISGKVDVKDFYSIEEKEERQREKIDLTEARELIKKKLAEMKLKHETEGKTQEEKTKKESEEKEEKSKKEKKEKKPKKEKVKEEENKEEKVKEEKKE